MPAPPAGGGEDAGGVRPLGVEDLPDDVGCGKGCGAALGEGCGFGEGFGDGFGEGLGCAGVWVGGWLGTSSAPPFSKRQPIDPPLGTESPLTPTDEYFQVVDFPSDQNSAQ